MRWAMEVARREAQGGSVKHSETLQDVWEDERRGILSFGYDADLEVEKWKAAQGMGVASRL